MIDEENRPEQEELKVISSPHKPETAPNGFEWVSFHDDEATGRTHSWVLREKPSKGKGDKEGKSNTTELPQEKKKDRKASQTGFSFIPEEPETYGTDQFGNPLTKPPKPFEAKQSPLTEKKAGSAAQSRKDNPGDWLAAKDAYKDEIADQMNNTASKDANDEVKEGNE